MARPSADVSIIIPVGTHHSRFVGEAVGSVLAGRCLPREILVVDDSAEPPVNAEALARIGVRSWRFPNPTGRSAARNVAVSYSSGSWLYFLDADDWMEHTALAEFAGIIRERPEVSVVWADYHARVPGRPYFRRCCQLPFSRDLLGLHNLAHIGLFVRRSRFDEVGGFDETLEIGEDRDLFIRSVLNPSVVLYKHKRPFLCVRKGSHSSPDAGERYGRAMLEINAAWAAGYYEPWRQR